MAAPDGLLIVDKPAGWTSHDVVGRCRRLTGTRKVGHAGTLDPMATGVLVLGVGRATRLLGHLSLATKAYDTTLRLGAATTTDDMEGDVVAEADASGVTDDAIAAAVAELTGDISQVPSAVSAVKIGGQRAYKRVRAGEAVELPARPVTVSEFTVHVVRRRGPVVEVDAHVECSTGTYVRALARDLGARLDVGGHLTALRRTRVGSFTLDRARTLDALAESLEMLPLDVAAVSSFATYTIDDDAVAGVRNGRPLDLDLGATGPVAVMTGKGEFLALYEQRGQLARPIAVFAPA